MHCSDSPPNLLLEAFWHGGWPLICPWFGGSLHHHLRCRTASLLADRRMMAPALPPGPNMPVASHLQSSRAQDPSRSGSLFPLGLLPKKAQQFRQPCFNCRAAYHLGRSGLSRCGVYGGSVEDPEALVQRSGPDEQTMQSPSWLPLRC